MAFIVSKLSSKEEKARKLYYIARAYREKLSGKSKRRILFSLGMSEDLNTALHFRLCQAGVLMDKIEGLQQDLAVADKGMLPSLIHYPRNEQTRIVLRDMSIVQEELEEIKLKVKELQQLKAEFPECSARSTP